MNKALLVEKIAQGAKLSQAQANNALNAFIKETMQSLKRGEKVKLVDFGTFSIAKRAEKKGTHPKNGSPIIIEAKKVVRFKAGKALDNRIK